MSTTKRIMLTILILNIVFIQHIAWAVENPEPRDNKAERPDITERLVRIEKMQKSLVKEIRTMHDAVINEMKIRDEALYKEMKMRNEAIISEMNSRFEAVDHRFTAIDKRFEDMNKRFEDMNSNFDKRLEEMNKNIDKRFELVQQNIANIGTSFYAILTAFVAMFAALLGFAIWDRKSSLKKAEEIAKKVVKEREIKQSSYSLDAYVIVQKVVEVMRKMSEQMPEMQSYMQAARLL